MVSLEANSIINDNLRNRFCQTSLKTRDVWGDEEDNLITFIAYTTELQGICHLFEFSQKMMTRYKLCCEHWIDQT